LAATGLSTSDPLNLAQLRAFLAIVDTGGFREAAAVLGCAQPTVSQLLRKCDEALGVALVLRSHTRCVPTSAGQRLLPLARPAAHGAACPRGRRRETGFGRRLGPSGSGKTSLLRTLNGFLQPHSGQMRFDGADIGRLRGSDLRALLRQIGFVAQKHDLVEPLRVHQNVMARCPRPVERACAALPGLATTA
jgi:DNA-binding transcriptional LysR family regulator